MSKRKNLYIVYAGTQSQGCVPVYQSTKKEKAYNYVHKVVMRDERYTKAYVECVHRREDRRSMWEEVD